MAKDLAWVATMAARLPGELQKGQKLAVRAAALEVTRGIRSEIRSASGGDNRLSGVGRRGARVGARFYMEGPPESPRAIIQATGPLHFLEHPTRPHGIAPRGGRRGSRALRLRNGQFAARVHHPGTRPSKPFERGYLRTREQAGKVFDKQVQGAIRRAMR